MQSYTHACTQLRNITEYLMIVARAARQIRISKFVQLKQQVTFVNESRF